MVETKPEVLRRIISDGYSSVTSGRKWAEKGIGITVASLPLAVADVRLMIAGATLGLVTTAAGSISHSYELQSALADELEKYSKHVPIEMQVGKSIDIGNVSPLANTAEERPATS